SRHLPPRRRGRRPARRRRPEVQALEPSSVPPAGAVLAPARAIAERQIRAALFFMGGEPSAAYHAPRFGETGGTRRWELKGRKTGTHPEPADRPTAGPICA